MLVFVFEFNFQSEQVDNYSVRLSVKLNSNMKLMLRKRLLARFVCFNFHYRSACQSRSDNVYSDLSDLIRNRQKNKLQGVKKVFPQGKNTMIYVINITYF